MSMSMSTKPTQGILFMSLLVMLLSMADVWQGIITLWITTDTYMHGLFIPALVVVMMRQMPATEHHSHPGSWFFASVLLGWALGCVISSYLLISTLSQAMAIASVPAFLIAAHGYQWAWHYRVPLLLWMMSLPFGDFMIPYLQSFTADMSVSMLQWTGVSVVRNGWYIRIPSADFRVAEACSGVNFLISTFTLSVFYSFMYFSSYTKRTVFIVLGAVVPILANGVRVYLIIMIAHTGNVEAATGFDHLVYGWIFFFAILGVLLLLGRLMQKNEHVEASCTSHPSAWIMASIPKRSAAVVLLVSAGVYGLSYHPVENSVIAAPVKTLSASIYPTANRVCVSAVSGKTQHAVFHYNEESVKSKLVSYENRVFDEKMWGLVSTSMTHLNIDGRIQPVKSYEIADLHGNKMMVYQSFRIAGYWHADLILLKWNQMIGKMLGTDNGGEVHLWYVIEPQETQSLYLTSECNSTDQFKGN